MERLNEHGSCALENCKLAARDGLRTGEEQGLYQN